MNRSTSFQQSGITHLPPLQTAEQLLASVPWRFVVSPPTDGASNMAWDEAAMEHAGTSGEGILRIYSWALPTLSLGRNQRARGVYDSELARASGIDVVRRPTGGRALLHWREITYSAAVPLAGLAPRNWYGAISAILLRALRSLGVPATLAAPGPRLEPPGSAPCFERPAPGEIVVHGRKLVGSALRAGKRAVLQHGSILIHDDQALVARLATVPVGHVVPAATLFEVLGREPEAGEIAAALLDALRSAGASTRALEPDAALLGLVDRARSRYADPGWTWRL